MTTSVSPSPPQPSSSSSAGAQVLPIDSSQVHFLPKNKESTSSLLPSLDVHCQIEDPSTIRTLQLAVDLLHRDELVAMPTETVYGLAGRVTSFLAIQKIFEYKHRPKDNPLILHFSSLAMLQRWVDLPSLPEHVIRMMATCWPGPLTLLLPVSKTLSPYLRTFSNLPTMAIRVPSHPIARALIEWTGEPLAAPSANLSGRPSPTRAHHVLEDFLHQPLLVLDAGPCEEGLESSVILVDPPNLLRPGPYTLNQLQRVEGWGSLTLPKEKRGEEEKEEGQPMAPGMKYRHYSPTCPVHLLHPSQSLSSYLQFLLRTHPTTPPHIGVLLLSGSFPSTPHKKIVVFDAREQPSALLFHGLRDLDAQKVDLIVVQPLHTHEALLNRLKKAASVVIDEHFLEKQKEKNSESLISQ